MKTIIKLEEFGMFIISAYFLYHVNIGINKWWYLLLFFAPDIGMIGYVSGNRAGAIVYNIFHHRLVASALLLTGYITGNNILTFTGIIMFSHISFDRMLGYGLKQFKGFNFTHLGDLKASGKSYNN